MHPIFNMNRICSLGGLLLILPMAAFAADTAATVEPMQATVAIVSVPMAGGDDRSSHLKLRDAVRFSMRDEEAQNKPYKLSAEERQRLREQLRSQVFDEQQGK